MQPSRPKFYITTFKLILSLVMLGPKVVYSNIDLTASRYMSSCNQGSGGKGGGPKNKTRFELAVRTARLLKLRGVVYDMPNSLKQEPYGR